MPEPYGQATATLRASKAARRLSHGRLCAISGYGQLLEMNFMRMGLSTVSAMIAATMFRMAAA
jgi:hypothetical protein